MNSHRFRIATPPGDGRPCTNAGTTIEMDGTELQGVSAIDIDRMTRDSIARVTVTMSAPMIVETSAKLCLLPAIAEVSRAEAARLLNAAMADVGYEDGRHADDEEHGLGDAALRFMALLVEQSGGGA